jgi:flagellin-like hook-associated protein FlgL
LYSGSAGIERIIPAFLWNPVLYIERWNAFNVKDKEDAMLGGTNPISSQLTSVYRDSTIALSDALTKLASGKKFQNAADDLHGFAQSNRLELEINGYQQVKQELVDAKTVTSAASTSGSTVYTNLTKMKEYAQKYINETNGSNDSNKLAEYAAEFNSLRSDVVSTLQNSYVDGTRVTQAGTVIRTVSLDPQGQGQLSINFSTVADDSIIGSINIAGMANTNGIQNEIDKALSYLSQSNGFSNIIDRQIKMSSVIVNNKEALKTMVSDVDEADQTTKAVDQSIRQNVSVAMIAQGNISQSDIGRLYG